MSAMRPNQLSILNVFAVASVCAAWLAATFGFGFWGGLVATLFVVAAFFVWRSQRKWRTLAAFATAYLLLGICVAELTGILDYSKTASRRTYCSNQMKQIGLALMQYHEMNGRSFPPAYTVDSQGRPLHSWRTLILPYMEEEDLYEKIRLNEPWNSPHNSQFHKTSIPIFICPKRNKNFEPPAPTTNYVAVVGPRTMWPGSAARKLSDITDGMENTILIVEVADSGIHWMEPRDLHVVQMSPLINATTGQGISSHHQNGANVLFADSSVNYLGEELSPEKLKEMLTIAGGEPGESASAAPRTLASSPDRLYRHYEIPREMVAVSFLESTQVLSVPETYASIQQAIDAASHGDLIDIAPGHYLGDVALKDGVCIAAREPGTVFINGVIRFASDVTLVNLTFEDAQLRPPLWAEGGAKGNWQNAKEGPKRKEDQKFIAENVKLLFCRFKGRHTSGRRGDNTILRIRGVSNLTVVGCLFSFAGEVGRGEMYGVHLQNCRKIVFSGNTIADLYEEKWGSAAGLVLEFCSGRISNNIVTDIHEQDWDSAYGVWIKEPRGLEVARNTIANITGGRWGSAYGIRVNGKGSCQITDNVVDQLTGQGWSTPVYGIYADNTTPSITRNNVSNLTASTAVPYFGTGGAQNSTVIPVFVDGSQVLVGPSILLSEQKNAIGAFSGKRISVVLPAGVSGTE